MSKHYPKVLTFPLLPVQAPRLQPPPSLWRVPGCKAHSWERLVFPFSLFLPPPGVSLDDEFIAGYTFFFFFFFFFLLPSFSSPLWWVPGCSLHSWNHLSLFFPAPQLHAPGRIVAAGGAEKMPRPQRGHNVVH